MKIDDVIARIVGRLDPVPHRTTPHYAFIEIIIRATVRELGLEVAANGEVYNPAPAPKAREWEAPQDNWRQSARPRRKR